MATLCNVDTRRGGKNSSCVRAKSCTLPEKEKLQVGVTPNCVHEKTKAWYVMRAAYGQEIKAKEYLDAKGFQTFLPIIDRMRLVKGKRVRKKESLIPNFLFVLSTEVELQKYVGSKDLSFFHYYYVPNMDEKGQPIGKNGTKPLIVSNNQMQQFRRWHEIEDDNKMFVNADEKTFSKNELVRINRGRFEGLCGFVCRYKGQSRVGISIEGLGTIVTAFIPKQFLEKI